jgi:hypothetical protein
MSGRSRKLRAPPRLQAILTQPRRARLCPFRTHSKVFRSGALRTPRGTFTVSVSAGDVRKVACAHNSFNSFLTSAKASEKVGRDLRYHAACRMACVL